MSVLSTPDAVNKAIAKLDAADQQVVLDYIHNLEQAVASAIPASTSRGVDFADAMETNPEEEDANNHEDAAMDTTTTTNNEEEPEFPPLYTSGDDYETAGNLKSEASELVAQGKYDEALDKLTLAVLAAEPSPLLYANRASVLLKLNRPRAAERDCTEALKLNPDSAKALRIRGKARKVLERWEEALHDLSESQTIDFDEDTVFDLKIVTDKVHELTEHKAHARLEEEDKLKKRAEEIKKRQEEAKRAAAEEAEAKKKASSASAGATRDFGGGMPGGFPGGMPGGFPGGMPGMPGGGGGGAGGGMPAGMAGIMQALLSDPELATALQNPKVMTAFSKLASEPGGVMGLMSNPSKLQELMSDPEVGPVFQKLLTKLGPTMGGAGGGMGGGFGGAAAGGGGGNADDIPDLDNIPDPD